MIATVSVRYIVPAIISYTRILARLEFQTFDIVRQINRKRYCIAESVSNTPPETRNEARVRSGLVLLFGRITRSGTRVYPFSSLTPNPFFGNSRPGRVASGASKQIFHTSYLLILQIRS